MPSQSYLAFNLIFFWTSQCMACFCFELTHVDQPMSCFPREVSVVWLPSFHDSYFGHNIKLVFSFHFVFLLFLFCLLFIDITIIIFLYNSRSKVMLMLTSTSSRNIQLLHFFSIFHRKIDLTTCGTWISYDKQCLQQDQMRHEGWVTHKKQCVKLTHQVATWLHNKFCTPSP